MPQKEQTRSGFSSSHQDLLDLGQRWVFGKPLALRGVLRAERVLDVRIRDGEEFLSAEQSAIKFSSGDSVSCSRLTYHS